MALSTAFRPLCRSCRASGSSLRLSSAGSSMTRQFSSSIPSRASGSVTEARTRVRSSRNRSGRVAIGLLGLSIPFTYFFYPRAEQLSPYAYSSQPISSTTSISDQHKLIAVAIPPGSKDLFTKPFRRDGSVVEAKEGEVGGEIVVQHMMIKSPDIQIERPYTPINDPAQDDEVRMVVKRVKGGEVGRVVHSLQPGSPVGIRGPIPTFSLDPGEYDRIVMISTGTGIAPFLQLLSKLPAPTETSHSTPKLHMIHSLPLPGRPDWVNPNPDSNPTSLSARETSYIPSLQQKFGSNLLVTRPLPGYIEQNILGEALSAHKKEKILVLVCLPPPLMRPLCGGMTPNLDQGPLTGLLAEMGLTSDQVLKLE